MYSDPEPSRPKSAENGSDASQNRSLLPESCTIATKKNWENGSEALSRRKRH